MQRHRKQRTTGSEIEKSLLSDLSICVPPQWHHSKFESVFGGHVICGADSSRGASLILVMTESSIGGKCRPLRFKREGICKKRRQPIYCGGVAGDRWTMNGVFEVRVEIRSANNSFIYWGLSWRVCFYDDCFASIDSLWWYLHQGHL